MQAAIYARVGAEEQSRALRLALYTRISDKDRQGDNFSLETQLDALRQYAGSAGHTVAAEFADKGSAWEDGLSRSELNKVLVMARQHQIDTVMFHDKDRFTRDIGDGVILRRELYRLGIKLICYAPYPREVTSENELVNILEDWQSQQYIEKLRGERQPNEGL
jgi:DNA invertase Pin-like site-specific DNA recombinase